MEKMKEKGYPHWNISAAESDTKSYRSSKIMGKLWDHFDWGRDQLKWEYSF